MHYEFHNEEKKKSGARHEGKPQQEGTHFQHLCEWRSRMRLDTHTSQI